MRTINEVLDAAKKARGLDTDYKLAKLLEVKPGHMSEIRDKSRAIDNLTACKLAEIIECDPMEIIAVVELDRAKTEARAGFWRSFLTERFGKSAVVAALVLTVSAMAALHGIRGDVAGAVAASVAAYGFVRILLYIIYIIRTDAGSPAPDKWYDPDPAFRRITTKPTSL